MDAKTPDEVLQNWSKIKKKEGREHLLDGIPKALPALLRATRMGEKAATVGFDWSGVQEVWKKIEEEIAEVKVAVGSPEKLEEEFGDLLFALVNYSRFIGVNPENALRRTVDKFIRRFQYIEQKLQASGKDIHNSTLGEMDALWNEAKSKF